MAKKDSKAKNTKTAPAKKEAKSSTQKVSKKETKKAAKPAKKQSGGDAKPKTPKKRYFKAIYEENGSVVCNGRYSGRKPKQAACKALTAITNAMKERGDKYEGVKINFCVIEQTRGSKNKKYYYEGSKFLLDEPVTVPIKKLNKKTKKKEIEEIEYKRGSKVMKCSEDQCTALVAFNPRKEDLEDDSEQEGGNKKGKAKDAKKQNKKPAKKADKKPAKKADKSKKENKKTTVKVAKKTSGKGKKEAKKN